MSRTLCLSVACALTLVLCLPGHSQDSPSLGDVARQAQKDKANKPAAKVITNEDMAPAVGDTAVFDGQPAPVGHSATTETSGAAASPSDAIQRLAAALDVVNSLDRATLARNALKGNDEDFPGRAQWEARLFAAKQTFVTQGRASIQKANQLMQTAESLKDVKDPNDPRVKAVNKSMQDFVRDCVQISSAFQAVMLE